MKFIIVTICRCIHFASCQYIPRMDPSDYWVAPSNPDTMVMIEPVGYNNTNGTGPLKAGYGWFVVQDNLIVKNRLQVDFERVEWICIHFNKYDTMTADNVWFGRVNDTTIRFKDSYGTCDPSDTPPDDGWNAEADSNNYDYVNIRQVDESIQVKRTAENFMDPPLVEFSSNATKVFELRTVKKMGGDNDYYYDFCRGQYIANIVKVMYVDGSAPEEEHFRMIPATSDLLKECKAIIQTVTSFALAALVFASA